MQMEVNSLVKLLHEYKSNCDHSKNNLTQQVALISERLGRTQEMHEGMRKSVEKIDDKLTDSMREITSSISTMNVSLATNGANHKHNGILIKWLMGICSGLLISVTAGLIMFFINKIHS